MRCGVCFDTERVNIDKNKVQNVFNLDDNVEPVYVINLGYRTDDCPENPMHNRRKNINVYLTIKFLKQIVSR